MSPRALATAQVASNFLPKELVNGEVEHYLKGPEEQLGLPAALVLSLVGQVVSPPQVFTHPHNYHPPA